MTQSDPSHYSSRDPEPRKVIEAWGLDFYEGNALKYLVRWRSKGGVYDLYKLKKNIDFLIEREGFPLEEEDGATDQNATSISIQPEDDS